MRAYLWVSLCALLGANLRYFLSRLIAKFSTVDFPYGTLIINVTGSLLLGFFLIWTTERVIAFLAESFGGLAALMAAIGLYGVLAYSTAQRTSEIGIRMALGATRASVVRVVLTEVLWLAGIAVAAALPLSLLLGRAVRSQLFGISSSDPLSLAMATLLIVLVAICAASLPARRAAKVDPIIALRYE